MYKKAIALSILIGIFSCNNKSENANKADVVASNMDTTISPSTDFFMYANGGWIKNNPIPGEQSAWGIGNLVIEENNKRLREICEKAAASNAKSGSNDQKIGDFWTTAMDSAKIEKDGLSPLKTYIDKINSVNDINSLLKTVAELKSIGSSTMFSDYVAQDAKNSDVMSYQLNQDGLGLQEREYYFKNDSTTVNIRNEYLKYISKILSMSGADSTTANAAAKNILALETKLATASRKIEDLRDPYKNYNKMASADLNKMASNLNWSMYMTTVGVKSADSVIVGQPEFFSALNNLLKTVPLDTWKSYLKFNLISDMAAVLPDEYGKTLFEFNKLFSGAKDRKPRWKRSIQMIEGAMGEMLGQLYVKEFFNETAKKRYTVMVDAIKDALKDRIGKLTWMSDSTKQKAYTKLASIKSKVGYPDKWKDFSSMEIGKESLAKNYIN